MKILQNLISKLYKLKFFSKVLLTYMVIVLFAVSTLAFIVSENVSTMILNREITYNKLILRNLNNFFDQKCDLVKKILQKTYMDNYLMPDMIDFIETDYDKSTSDYISLKQKFIGYFLSSFSQDIDITGITIYKKADNSIFSFSKNSSLVYNASEFIYPERLEQITDPSYHLKIIPAFYPKYNNESNDMVYTISINIRQRGTNKNIGILMIDFDLSGFNSYLSEFQNDIKAQFLMLTENGDVIYDSTGEYNEKKSQYVDAYTSKLNSAKINGEEYVINMDTENSSSVIAASFVQKKAILRSIMATKQTIFMVSILCILTVLLLTYLSTKIFSKRIKAITGAMKELQAGNLSVRITVRETGDEISNIAVKFNKMSDELSEYINKVYISDIKQKSAEMAALQAQINPHFLYNTLEAIRMNAVAFGDHRTSEMIYVLSKLFRNTIKEDSIITIKDELKHSKLYLELFKMRYGDSLSVKFDVDDEILEYGIIKHLIQPVIENYIVHGFDTTKSNNSISVRGYLDDKNIFFIITDNGKGIEAENLDKMKLSLENFEMNSSGSIGLANINERIKLVYGKECGVDISSINGKGTTVKIKILIKTKKELNSNV
jgi:two-component system, sensor histidine kinase YesM